MSTLIEGRRYEADSADLAEGKSDAVAIDGQRRLLVASEPNARIARTVHLEETTLSSSWTATEAYEIPDGVQSIGVLLKFTRAAEDADSAFRTRVLLGDGTNEGTAAVIDSTIQAGGLPAFAQQFAYPGEIVWPAPESDSPVYHAIDFKVSGGWTTFKVVGKSYGAGGNGALEITLTARY